MDSVSPYDDRTVDVYMKIEEGDKYYLRNVTWVGNTIYASDWLNEQLRMKKGDVYNQKLMTERLTVMKMLSVTTTIIKDTFSITLTP